MPAGLTSPTHLFVIIVVALVVLGPEKLPQALRQAGRTLGEVRRWSDSISGELRGALSLDADDEAPVVAPPALAKPVPPSVDIGTVVSGPPSPPTRPQTDIAPSRHPALKEGGEWH